MQQEKDMNGTHNSMDKPQNIYAEWRRLDNKMTAGSLREGGIRRVRRERFQGGRGNWGVMIVLTILTMVRVSWILIRIRVY